METTTGETSCQSPRKPLLLPRTTIDLPVVVLIVPLPEIGVASTSAFAVSEYSSTPPSYMLMAVAFCRAVTDTRLLAL